MKEKIMSVLFISFLLGFGILYFVIEDKDISALERRKLININNVKEDFVSNLDSYMEDQMPLRDNFITLNSLYTRYIIQNKESNNVYLNDGYLTDKNYPLDDTSVNNFINKINYIYDYYLNNSNSYFAIIPDKSIFLPSSFPKIDYEDLEKKLSKSMHMSYIDIASKIRLEDFYKTDIHLKQESYFKIVDIINDNFQNAKVDLKYDREEFSGFYGSSYSKAPFVPSEIVSYYNNDDTDKAVVKHLEYGLKKIYDIEALNHADKYDFFLSGPSAYLEIENNNITGDKELIIFRDSFASSMAPLLVSYYHKITLVDLRYISFDYLLDKIDFNNKDVLFLYSTLIVNKSSTLKINM